ncbi:MAG: ferredoxin--NADP reductase, partial [Acidobacteriota bacterium]
HLPTDDRGSDRWFTVASAPYEKAVMVTTRLTEKTGSTFKQALRALEVGKSIEISYVEGDFVIDDPEQQYVFIAGGIGITPFHSILKEAHKMDRQLHVRLLYGNRNEDILFKAELESFAKSNPHLVIQYVISPKRIDEEAINTFVPDLNEPAYYISGPEPMVMSLRDTLKKMGVAEDQIKLDDFPGYTAY